MYEDYVNSGMTRGVRVAINWINMNPEKECSLEKLASMSGYAPYYFSKIFKKETGCSVSEYYKSARIKHAEFLLSTTRLTIQDISERLHFCTRNYFASEFKRITGKSPAEYRNGNLNL